MHVIPAQAGIHFSCEQALCLDFDATLPLSVPSPSRGRRKILADRATPRFAIAYKGLW
jgi:hypothetical protein